MSGVTCIPASTEADHVDSGIRYANADESLVFSGEGNTAFATEGNRDEPTFADCVEPEM